MTGYCPDGVKNTVRTGVTPNRADRWLRGGNSDARSLGKETNLDLGRETFETPPFDTWYARPFPIGSFARRISWQPLEPIELLQYNKQPRRSHDHQTRRNHRRVRRFDPRKILGVHAVEARDYDRGQGNRSQPALGAIKRQTNPATGFRSRGKVASVESRDY